MKRHWIEYTPEQPEGPMTYWVHREADGKDWFHAKVFDPPRQPAIVGRGYPLFLVEIDGVTLRFTSLAELQVCIETLGQKLLPTTRALTAARGSLALNHHWLSRLPRSARPWRYREKAVRYLSRAAEAFEKALTSST
jgi:hypothetical protein